MNPAIADHRLDDRQLQKENEDSTAWRRNNTITKKGSFDESISHLQTLLQGMTSNNEGLPSAIIFEDSKSGGIKLRSCRREEKDSRGSQYRKRAGSIESHFRFNDNLQKN